jgi:hypothetical protein
MGKLITVGPEFLEMLFSGRSTVAKRSYSRAIFRSFYLTRSHYFSVHKYWRFLGEPCETHTNIEDPEIPSNQIPPSAPQLFQALARAFSLSVAGVWEAARWASVR